MPTNVVLSRILSRAVAAVTAMALLAGTTACIPQQEARSAVMPDPESKYGLPKLVGIEPVIRPETVVLSDPGSVRVMTITNPERCLEMVADRPKCEFLFEFSALPTEVILGSVLVSDVTPAMPSGALVKVTRIEGETVTAIEATLSDAIEDGEFLAEQDFGPSDVASIQTLAGVTLEPAPSDQSLGLSGGLGMGVARPMDETSDGFELKVGADIVEGVHATGSVGFTIGCGVYGGLTWKKKFGIPIYPNGAWFQGQCGASQNGSLTISSDDTKLVSESIEIAKMTMNHITFFIGPVPVVLVPHIAVSINADGSVKTGMSFGASEGFSAVAGIKYSNGFSQIKDFKEPSFDTTVAIGSGRLSLEAGVVVGANILLYGIAGPEVTLTLYARLEGAPIGTSPVWCIKGGLRAGVGIRLDLGIENLVWGPEELFDTSVDLACAPNQAPELTAPAAMTLFPGVAGAPGQISLTATDPEDGPVSVSFSSDISGALGTADPGKSLRVDTLPFGQHTITATAKDSEGLTKTVTFSVTALDSSPSLGFTVKDGNGNWVPTSEVSGPQGGSVNIQVVVSNGIGTYLNTCNTVKWTGPLSVGAVGGCEFVVTLSQAGTFSLVATTTDPDGKKGSGSLTVGVAAPQANPAPLFGEITVAALGGRGIQDNGYFEAGDQAVFVLGYQNFDSARVPVRYSWSYTLSQNFGPYGSAVPLTSGGSDSNVGSSRQFTAPSQLGVSNNYRFTVTVYNSTTNAVVATRTVRISYTGAPR